MSDVFWNQYLHKEAERIARKNDEDFDKQSAKTKRIVIEMMMEDLNDKYRE